MDVGKNLTKLYVCKSDVLKHIFVCERFVAFASGCVLVLWNWKNDRYVFLQGHRHRIDQISGQKNNSTRTDFLASVDIKGYVTIWDVSGTEPGGIYKSLANIKLDYMHTKCFHLHEPETIPDERLYHAYQFLESDSFVYEDVCLISPYVAVAITKNEIQWVALPIGEKETGKIHHTISPKTCHALRDIEAGEDTLVAVCCSVEFLCVATKTKGKIHVFSIKERIIWLRTIETHEGISSISCHGFWLAVQHSRNSYITVVEFINKEIFKSPGCNVMSNTSDFNQDVKIHIYHDCIQVNGAHYVLDGACVQYAYICGKDVQESRFIDLEENEAKLSKHETPTTSENQEDREDQVLDPSEAIDHGNEHKGNIGDIENTDTSLDVASETKESDNGDSISTKEQKENEAQIANDQDQEKLVQLNKHNQESIKHECLVALSQSGTLFSYDIRSSSVKGENMPKHIFPPMTGHLESPVRFFVHSVKVIEDEQDDNVGVKSEEKLRWFYLLYSQKESKMVILNDNFCPLKTAISLTQPDSAVENTSLKSLTKAKQRGRRKTFEFLEIFVSHANGAGALYSVENDT